MPSWATLRIPPMTIIGQAERDALCGLVLNHFSGIGDWPTAIEADDFERAARLEREFMQDRRLLADLGWGGTTDKTTFPLTMPPEELREVLTRLREDAVAQIVSEEREEAEEREAARPYRERAALVIKTCDAAMRAIDAEDAQDERVLQAT